MTGQQVLRAVIAQLSKAGIEGAAGDARRLLAHAMQIAPDRLMLHLPEVVSPEALSRLDLAVHARIARQPVSQIVGGREFWGRRFKVTSDVLDPRPETETLIAAALEQVFVDVLDLGTGSGVILLTLLAERAMSRGVGVDYSEAALKVARENAALLGLQERVEFVQSDWFERVGGRFDLIVSNPPYIAQQEMAGLAPEVRDWEPHLALTPGGDGLDAYRAIASGVSAHLKPGGWLMVEIGPSQADAVMGLFDGAGLVAIKLRTDLDGRDRVVQAQAPLS